MKRMIGVMALAAGAAFAQDADPPSRVARLNYLEGSVSFQPAGVEEWTAATLNYPLTTGDQLWVDNNSRAEMHIGSAAFYFDGGTAFSFLNLDDTTVQIRLTQGAMYVRLRNPGENDVYEMDTPNGAISLVRPGSYRIDADPDRQTTAVTVHDGQAEVSSSGAPFQVFARQSGILVGADSPAQEVRSAAGPDNFDNWRQARESREDRLPAPRYVSREMPGYEDLDTNGSWQDDPEYGAVWAPRVSVDWAPYRFGHWRWIEPWGWTWIDDAPWGFAPFHYGRWAYMRNSWFWVPGPVVARPVYAPALVAFVGGSNWNFSVSIGGGGGVGWFPLGPREVYRPAYRVSPAYVSRVNVIRVTNVNMAGVRYVNQSVPGAVTVVSRTDFTTARHVARVAVRVQGGAIASAPVLGAAPAIAPRRESIVVRREDSVRISRPPERVYTRTVVTRRTPPPAPVSFSARQSALEANPGKPVDSGTLGRLRENHPAPRLLARPVAAQPAEDSRGRRIQPQPAPAPQPRPAQTERVRPERPQPPTQIQPQAAPPERVRPERPQQQERPVEMRREQVRQPQPEPAQPPAPPRERVRPERPAPEPRRVEGEQRREPKREEKREEKREDKEERSRGRNERREKDK
ncbi:MAG TPA: DUF6600 domain-containing protein [Bryobacteraceae bacterium]|nr:DUF6600 domain-containing protein [Bryobacteraceae bacterium]